MKTPENMQQQNKTMKWLSKIDQVQSFLYKCIFLIKVITLNSVNGLIDGSIRSVPNGYTQNYSL